MHILMSRTIRKYVAYNPRHHITHYRVFQSSHVYRRRTFPTFNSSTWLYVYVYFEWPYYSKMFTCVTHSKSRSENPKGPGSPCHYIPYLVENGPLCRHRIRARRVIFDNLAHFNFIIIMCDLFITLISDGFLSRVSWLHLFMGYFDVAVCARLPWGLATWPESLGEDCQLAI